MLKFEVLRNQPDLFDDEQDQNIYFTVSYPEIDETYVVKGVPGHNMFTFHRTKPAGGILPQYFRGSFTEIRLVNQAIENYARNYTPPMVAKAPKTSQGFVSNKAS
jgi:hypothetical protein